MKHIKNKRLIKVGAGNFISQISFAWVFWFIWVICRAKDLTDLQLVLRKSETSSKNDEILDKKWKDEISQAGKQDRKPLIRRAIFKSYGALFVCKGMWKIVWGMFLWFGAYWLLKQTINYVRIKSTNRLAGHMYALGFFFSSFIASIGIHQLLSQSGCLGLRVKSALMIQIFRKSLVLARIKGGAGDLVNLVSNDCAKVADAFTNLHYLWSAVIELFAILTLSFIELGYSAFPALAVIVVIIPMQLYLGWLKSKIGFENTTTTSRRVHIMSEILTAIKLIKFYAWEQPFFDRICKIRKKELSLLRKDLMVNAVNFMVVISAPVIVSLLALLMYWKTGNEVNPVIGFTVISVFNTLRYPLIMAPLAVNSASGELNLKLGVVIYFPLFFYIIY